MYSVHARENFDNVQAVWEPLIHRHTSNSTYILIGTIRKGKPRKVPFQEGYVWRGLVSFVCRVADLSLNVKAFAKARGWAFMEADASEPAEVDAVFKMAGALVELNYIRANSQK